MSTVCGRYSETDAAWGDEALYEVVAGQRVELEPMGVHEIVLASALVGLLEPFARQNGLGRVVSEMLFLLDAARDLKRRPDVAFVSFSRWPEPTVGREEAWNTVPDLAVEIISRTNTADTVDDKVVEYFEAGVRLVWVVFPNTRRVYVYRSSHEVRVLERHEELDGGDVLPGFRLSLQLLFDAVKKPQALS
jgi:Uma2 family endonuclease